MALSMTCFKHPVKVCSLGILLGLAINTVWLPTDVYAKSKKPVASSSTLKKANKKAVSVKMAKASKASQTVHQTTKASKKISSSHRIKHYSSERVASEPVQAWYNTHTDRQKAYLIPGKKPSTHQRHAQTYSSFSIQQHPLPLTNTSPHNAAKSYQVGTASYYNNSFEGKRTASGERFSQNAMTCAHGSLPFGCLLRVTNLRNNKSVDVRVNDRGGFHKYGRVLDLSKAAAREIGMMGTGTAKVRVEVLNP